MIKADITIHTSEKEVKKRLGNLAERSGAVISRAANRAAGTGRKVIRQETARVYNVRQKDVSEILDSKKATTRHPVAVLVYRDVHKNLYHFGFQSSLGPRYVVRSTRGRADPKYVKAKVFKRGARVPLSGTPKPFVQVAKKSGKIGLFQRTSKASRAPIRGVAAPSMPQIINNKEVIARFTREVNSMFEERLVVEIDNILKGITR